MTMNVVLNMDFVVVLLKEGEHRMAEVRGVVSQEDPVDTVEDALPIIGGKHGKMRSHKHHCCQFV